MTTSFEAYFPRKPQHLDEVVIKFKLTDSAANASFNFCTAAKEGESKKTHKLEISFPTNSKSKLKLTWQGIGEKPEKEIDNKLVLHREVIYTLVFRLFDGTKTCLASGKKIQVFLERTQGDPTHSMDLEVALDQIHSVQLGGAFEYVKAIMFRFNEGHPANDQAMVCGCERHKTCAWCTCCVGGKPNPKKGTGMDAQDSSHELLCFLTSDRG